MEEKIRNYFNQDFCPNGLTVEEIAKGVGSSDIYLVEKVTKNMFNNDSVIIYRTTYKKYDFEDEYAHIL